MATKGFGYTPTITWSNWAGSGYSHGVALRTTMPETGKIVAILVKLARYDSNQAPRVWGMVWNRSTGAILSQSANYISPTNNYNSSMSNLQLFNIPMPETEIAGGTPLWVGFAKDSSAGGLALYWGTNKTSGVYMDEEHSMGSTPTAFTVDATHTGEAMYVEVYYKTGGEIKVIDGNLNPVVKPVKVWNGATWAGKPLKIWSGTAWVESNS